MRQQVVHHRGWEALPSGGSHDFGGGLSDEMCRILRMSSSKVVVLDNVSNTTAPSHQRERSSFFRGHRFDSRESLEPSNCSSSALTVSSDVLHER